MLITINGVDVSKDPKGYMRAEVKFTREGKDETRKILSFASPAVFASLTAFKTFPVDVNVRMEKNEKTNYWDWKEIEIQPKMEQNETAQATTRGVTYKSTYETPEERARKQVYIIRQSSVSTAVELAKAQAPKGTTKSVEEVILEAKVIEKYVFSGVDGIDPTQDIPF